MARVSGKLDAILAAIVARIIAQVSGANAATCYLCLNPDTLPVPNPGDFVYVVAPTSGRFDDRNWDGGGQDQATVDPAGVVVKIHSALQLDEAQREATFLTDTTHGILEKWRLVVKALTAPDWNPAASGSGDILVRDPLIPADFAMTRSNRGLGAIEQNFRFSFDLDLS